VDPLGITFAGREQVDHQQVNALHDQVRGFLDEGSQLILTRLLTSAASSQHVLKLRIVCEALILAFLEKSIANGRPVDQINGHWLSDKAGYVADDRLICHRRPVEWMHTSRTQSHPYSWGLAALNIR
jgi:hypothetical protein